MILSCLPVYSVCILVPYMCNIRATFLVRLSDPEAGNEGSATVVQGMSGACSTYRQHSDTAPTE